MRPCSAPPASGLLRPGLWGRNHDLPRDASEAELPAQGRPRALRAVPSGGGFWDVGPAHRGASPQPSGAAGAGVNRLELCRFRGL